MDKCPSGRFFNAENFFEKFFGIPNHLPIPDWEKEQKET
jgi:hypothetical protein